MLDMLNHLMLSLRFNVNFEKFQQGQLYHHTETSHLICSANQLIGFYVVTIVVLARLI